MNVRYVFTWLRYQHFWRFVYRPVKPYDTGIYLYFTSFWKIYLRCKAGKKSSCCWPCCVQ